MAAASELSIRRMTAEEAIAELQSSGAVRDAHIVGDIKLAGSTWPQNISLTNCEFDRHVDCSHATFERLLTLSDCTFRRGLNLDRARFKSEVQFKKLTLRGHDPQDFSFKDHEETLCLNDCHFEGVFHASDLNMGIEDSTENFLTAMRATFDSDVFITDSKLARSDFRQARFGRSLFLSSTQWFKTPGVNHGSMYVLDMEACSISQDLVCLGLECNGEANWQRSRIVGKADFTNAHFLGKTNFDYCVVGHLVMTGARIEPSLTLCYARLDSLILTYMNVNDLFPDQGAAAPSIDLSGATISQNAWFEHSTFADFVAIGVRVGLQASVNHARFRGKFLAYEMTIDFSWFALCTKFESEVDLNRCRIGGEAYFSGATFQQGATIQNAAAKIFSFAPYISEDSAKGATSVKTRIDGRVNLNGSECACVNATEIGRIDALNDSASDPEIILDAMTISSRVAVSGTLSCLSMRHASVTASLDIRAATIDAQLLLLGARLGSLKIGTARLPRAVDLRSCEYKSIEIDNPLRVLAVDESTPRQTPFDRQPFVTLAQLLRTSDSEQVARDVQVQKNSFDHRNAHGMRRVQKAAWRLLALYGYSARRLIAWTMVAWLSAAWILSAPNMFVPPPDRITDTNLVAECAQPMGFVGAGYIALNRILPISLPSSTQCQPKPTLVTPRASDSIVFALRQPLLACFLLLVVAWLFIPLIVAHYTGLLRRLDV